MRAGLGKAVVWLLAVTLTALLPGAVRADALGAGSLDRSFGSGGVGEEVSPYRESYWGKKVAVQADGRIMVLARTTGVQAYDLIRYNADGTVDRTFGREGVARTLSWWSQGTVPGTLASQPVDGVSKTLVEIDGAIVRYDESGMLDTTFGSGGEAYGPLAATGPPRDIELSPSGDRIYALNDPGKMGISIVYAGYQAMPQVVSALTSDGQDDESFGVAGAAVIGVPITYPTGFKDLAVQPDGKIVISGGSLTARLLPTGNLDATFGDHGFVIDDTNDGRWNQHVGIDSQGRLLVMRCFHSNSQVWGEMNWGCRMVRYLPDGQRDLSYGNGGVATLPSWYSTSFEIDSKDRSVIFGAEISADHFTILRLTADGARDASFGDDGLVVTFSDTGGEVYVGAGTLQGDDKPVRLGMFFDQIEWEKELRIWRYLAEPEATSDPYEPATVPLTGRVLDAKAASGIPGATVDCGPGAITFTDAEGAYALDLVPGTYTCTATATGYRSSKARITVESETTYDFKLR